jgi:hypothetical protein
VRAYPSRFTPVGDRFGVLYLALAPETATAELRRRAAQLGVPLATRAPRARLTLAVRLTRGLDRTDVGVRTAQGVEGLTRTDRASDDYVRCQDVAVAAGADGDEAIREPSAAVARGGRRGRGPRRAQRRRQPGRLRGRAAPRVRRARRAQRGAAAK